MPPRVSVIVPALQAADNILSCIRSLLAQDLPARDVEVIVVDNGSTDATCELASREAVRLVTERRRGRSAARNHGARLAQGEILAFIDADCEAPPDWLRRAIEALDRPWVGAVQARVQKHGRPPPGAEFTQAYYYRPFLDTCALVTTRAAYDAAQGYDEELRRNVDMDFSFRLLACGYAFVWLPSVIMIKHHDLTPRQIFRRGWDGGISVAVLAKKWPQLSPRSPVRVWRDRGLAWARPVWRDARHPLSSRGHSALEATVKLAATVVTELRGRPVERAALAPATVLPALLGTARSLVLCDDGALVYDAACARQYRLDATQREALRQAIDAGDREQLERLLRDPDGG